MVEMVPLYQQSATSITKVLYMIGQILKIYVIESVITVINEFIILENIEFDFRSLKSVE